MGFSRFSIILLVLLSIGASSNAQTKNSVGKVMPPDAAPLDRQVFRYFIAEPTTLDISVAVYAVTDGTILFERLLALDENNQIIPAVAERWESSPDGRIWTFHLRRGATWTDGHPVTAHDFEYSFKRMVDPQSGNVYAFFYYDIKGARAFNQGQAKDASKVGVRAIDDYTFQIEAEHPCPYLPYLTSFPTSSPVPRWQVERYGPKWTEEGNWVGNSSYRLVEWKKGRRLVYELNPRYNGPNKGYIERYVAIINPVGGVGAGTVPYENNEMDRLVISTLDLDRVRKDPVLSKELWRWPVFTTWYLIFKTQAPPFDKVEVRQAISHAIDREAICDVVLKGLGTPAYTMLPPQFPGYVGDKYREIQRYDPRLAQELLAKAGYPGGKGFPEVEMWTRQASQEARMIVQAIQGMLKGILGITVKIRDVEQKAYMDNMYQHTIPMSFIAFGYDYPDPNNMFSDDLALPTEGVWATGLEESFV
ncbi:MAG: peptide ABC transporter substrate-binding protein [Candidatus Latescibacteria bacterium]|nr:peptide ABC transporter substrate-binding protein [Candidatus Latescibacterota bacterium]